MATFTVPLSVPYDGLTNATVALQSFINSVPSGTSGSPNIIEFPQPGGPEGMPAEAVPRYLIAGNASMIGQSDSKWPTIRTTFPASGMDPNYPVPADVVGKTIPDDLLGPRSGGNPTAHYGWKLDQPNLNGDLPALKDTAVRGFGRGVRFSYKHDLVVRGTGVELIQPSKFVQAGYWRVSGTTGWVGSGQTPNWGFNNNQPFDIHALYTWGLFTEKLWEGDDIFEIYDYSQNIVFEDIYFRGGQIAHQTMIPSNTENQHVFIFQGVGIRNIEIRNSVFHNCQADFILYQPGDNPGKWGCNAHDNEIIGTGRQCVTPRGSGFRFANNNCQDQTRWCWDITTPGRNDAPAPTLQHIHFIGNTWDKGADPYWHSSDTFASVGQMMGYGDQEGICRIDDLRVIGETLYRAFRWYFKDLYGTDPQGSRPPNKNWVIAENEMPLVWGYDGQNLTTEQGGAYTVVDAQGNRQHYPGGITTMSGDVLTSYPNGHYGDGRHYHLYGDEIQNHNVSFISGPHEATLMNVAMLHCFGNKVQGTGNDYFWLPNSSGACHDNDVSGPNPGSVANWANGSPASSNIYGRRSDSGNRYGYKYRPGSQVNTSHTRAFVPGAPTNVHFLAPGTGGGSTDGQTVVVDPGDVVQFAAAAVGEHLAKFYLYGLFELPTSFIDYFGFWFATYTVPPNAAIGTQIPFAFKAWNFDTEDPYDLLESMAGVVTLSVGAEPPPPPPPEDPPSDVQILAPLPDTALVVGESTVLVATAVNADTAKFNAGPVELEATLTDAWTANFDTTGLEPDPLLQVVFTATNEGGDTVSEPLAMALLAPPPPPVIDENPPPPDPDPFAALDVFYDELRSFIGSGSAHPCGLGRPPGKSPATPYSVIWPTSSPEAEGPWGNPQEDQIIWFDVHSLGKSVEQSVFLASVIYNLILRRDAGGNFINNFSPAGIDVQWRRDVAKFGTTKSGDVLYDTIDRYEMRIS